jgi:hypothetical protein
MVRSVYIAGLLTLVLAAVMPAQRGGGRGGGGMGRGPGIGISRQRADRTPIDQWNQMSPEERDKAIQSLPPERQKQMRQKLATFNSLPTAEKQALREHYEAFSKLSPERQDLVRRQMRKFGETPPERRKALAREFQDLRNMPAAERQERIASEEFRSKYSPEEREMLQDLSENLSNAK